jgi:hypothetical protein
MQVQWLGSVPTARAAVRRRGAIEEHLEAMLRKTQQRLRQCRLDKRKATLYIKA